MEDKRGQEGPHVEFGRLPFEDSARLGGSAMLREIKQGEGLDAGVLCRLPPSL